jgi:benzylsuccinate CoA-transferase BbsE subunit
MLRPYRVLDLTDGRCRSSRVRARRVRADVIKVEPPGGFEPRLRGPLDPDQPSALASLRFHAFNRGKRSVVLDLDTPGGRADFLALVASSDFLFENAGPGAMDALGLGFDALRGARPDLVYVAISPFGQTGPYAHHIATDLTLAAMGGAMALNGDSDRRPVRVPAPSCAARL